MTTLLTVVLVLAVEKFEMTNEYGLLVFAYSIIGVILDVLLYLTIENDIPLRLTEPVGVTLNFRVLLATDEVAIYS